MSELEEIRDLLREIRDLQRAHFERYKEFTQDIVNDQRAANEEAERARREGNRFRDEMRRQVSTAWTVRLILIGLAAAAVVVAMGVTLFPWFLSLARP